MDTRSAEPSDRQRLRELADQSFRASFSLSPERIETLLDGVLSGDALADRIEDPDALLLVAEHEVDGELQVAGFADADLDTGTLRWLHVDPEARGLGIGTALFERVREATADRGGRLVARILEEASEGGEFCTQFGLSRVGTGTLEFGEELFREQLYAAGSVMMPEPTIDVPARVEVDGEELFVDRADEIPGTDAPFVPVYRTASREERYGYLCTNCGSIDVSADGLDRLECGDCANTHLADQWDAAYL